MEDSPAHLEEYETLALKRILVADVMTKRVQSVKPSTSVKIAQDLMETSLVVGLPVLSDGKLVGMVTKIDILKVEPSKRAEEAVDDLMTRQLVFAYPEEDLFSALTRMMTRGVGRLPVVSHEAPDVMIGIITRTDISKAIEKHRSTPNAVTGKMW